ncbi:riboflavin transporter mch5 [Lichtheimia corymbifera JMRC:FSU:9682]|uniref:Riboflavin transporter mch5 n=1 Tax=Lichtheimia corymbifera JMRC:FSU:9682 TaxID=1263082 RepID=A0A068RT74_9FUNG|nr:riboflavin transporter mch5 [Lichtheimia corymbifera JMRC:FSU:9682]
MDDRYAIALGGLITALSMMLASITNEIWQLWITQGILAGIGSSLVYYPCLNQTMTWFSSRRAVALGISMSGIGFSSIAFTNIATACFQTVGYRWALRVFGFIALVLCGIGAVLCIKLNPRPKSSVIPLLDISVFKYKKFVILIVAHFIGAFVFYIPESFIAPYAESFGVDPFTIANITGIMAVFNSIGSITLGFVADYIGRFNMAIFVGLLCVVMQLGVWFTAATVASLWAFSVVYGMALATFNSLLITVIVDCAGIERSEVGTGWAIFTWSFGALLGQPLASRIVNQTEVPNYRMAIVFSSVIFFFVTCLMLVLRIMIGGWKVFKKV